MLLYIQTAKGASSLLKSMDRLSEIVIRSNNVTRTNFSGDNFGKQKYLLFLAVELTFCKIEENGSFCRGILLS